MAKIQISINDLRLGLEDFASNPDYKGKKLYLTRYNKVVGEIKFYNPEEIRKATLEIAKALMKETEQ